MEKNALYQHDKPKHPHGNVQSVVFAKKDWTIPRARKWLHDHGFICPKVDIEANTIRFRQVDPKMFSGFFTKKLGDGIELVIGFS
jgi:hypothetical protein